MTSNVLLSLFAFIPFFVSAQPDSIASQFGYFNAFHAGGLFGKSGNGSDVSVATIHGVQLNKFRVGIGVGYDAYENWRTLPVFLSAAYDFLPVRGNAFFVQLNGGYSKAWHHFQENDLSVRNIKPGPCAHPVLGYRLRGNKFELYVTAGYKVQRLEYEQTPLWWTNNPGSKISVSRDMGRLSIQLGFGFR